MERRPRIRFPKHITPVTDLNTYFQEYSDFISSFQKNSQKNRSLFYSEEFGINETEFTALSSKFSRRNFSWKSSESQGVHVPVKGFDPMFSNFEIPPDTKLKSLICLREKQNGPFKRKGKIRYINQISCDYPEGKEGVNKKDARVGPSEYLLNVRVYIPTNLHPYMYSGKQARPTVSQEFLVIGRQPLDSLRDRILCPEDLVSAEGDVSINPFSTTRVTNQHIYRSSMFFIDDTFYIDSRQPGSIDYSTVIKEWSEGKGLKYGETKNMSSVCFDELKLRLGFPYLYLHQGSCEHIIIFTDARLIAPDDVLVRSAYPLMISFGSGQIGKKCQLCGNHASKFIVTGMKYLPHMKAYLCGQCLYLYCYDKDGNKICDFSVFKYIDRVAIF